MPEDLPKEEVKVGASAPEVSKPEEKPVPNKKSRLLILLIVFGVLILIFIGLVGWRMLPHKISYDSNSEMAKYLDGDETISPTIAKSTFKPVTKIQSYNTINLLTDLRDYLDLKNKIDSTIYYYVLDIDQKNLGSDTTKEPHVSGQNIFLDEYDAINFAERTSEENLEINRMVESIDYYFEEQGFVEQGKLKVSDSNYGGKRYRKDDFLCIVNIGVLNERSRLFCGKIDKNYQVLISELKPIIDKANIQFGQKQQKITQIERVDGKFLLGATSIKFVSKKENSKWVFLYFEDLPGTIPSPTCDYVEENEIPYDIQDVCIKDDNLINRKFLKE